MYPAVQIDSAGSGSLQATIVPLAQVYDLPSMLKRCMDDRELAALLFEKFHTRLPVQLGEIERCLRENDLAAAQSLVHSLKGEAGNLAAGRLHEAAAGLQDALRGGTTNDLDRLTASLRSEAELCLRSYAAALATIVGTPTVNNVGTPTVNNVGTPTGNNVGSSKGKSV
jgi:HPt (histidine-containing phosphotransfer) domain-containing protein